jgi:apolipoprotein N-acyltransferase
LPDAELLVNMSNMAWYGHSLAAEQHVQFSQMRAMETSRWMLRSTNTGVTAAVNERGEIVKALPQFTRGVLDIDAVPRQGATLYVRWRDAPVLIFLVVILVAAAILKTKQAARA